MRAVEAVTYHSVVPINMIVSCDYGSDVAELEQAFPVFSIEKQHGVRHGWSNSHLNYAFGQDAASFLMAEVNRRQPDLVRFLSFSSSILLETFLHTSSIPSAYVCLSSEKKNIFDDKIMLHHWLSWLGLEVIPSRVELLGNADYSTISKKYGSRIVVKFPVGAGGGKVHLVEDRAHFRELQMKNSSSFALLQKHILGIPVNLQGVITRDGITWSIPSVQIVGPVECTQNIFEWCGNDFGVGKYLQATDIHKILATAETIAQQMKVRGYLGILGLDFIFDESSHTPYCLEINPRLQGSTALLTQLEILNRSEPLMLTHMQAFDTDNASARVFQANVTEPFEVHGSQIILHNTWKFPVQVTSSIPFGIYSFDKSTSELVYRRKGYTLLDCTKIDEFVIAGGVPMNGQVIMPGASMLWIQFYGSALADPSMGHLNNDAKAICKAINEKIVLKAIT